MSAELDEAYFVWLYAKTGSVKLRHRAKSHWALLRQLHAKEFVWLILNDDNRVQDGLDLRTYFIREMYGEDAVYVWTNRGCSFLEMLIALSNSLSFEADGDPRNWFWHLMEQMDLEQFNDRDYNDQAIGVIDQTLDRVIFRQYNPDGSGGLFPLRNPAQDQRQVDLWYQLNAYLNELF